MTEEQKIFLDNLNKKWDAYFIDGTNILKNKLGITKEEELKKVDANISFKNLLDLYVNPIEGSFDKNHLCAIHKKLFGDLYPFAGKYRTVYMQKGNSSFVGENDIDWRLDITLNQMNEDIKKVKSIDYYAIFLANYYNELIVIHPFREGNGRTIREFLREFVNAKNELLPIIDLELDWSLVNKDNLLTGIRQAFFSKSLLELEFKKALIPKEDTISPKHK